MVEASGSVLITGAGGQLGSVLLPLARDRGMRVWGTVSPRRAGTFGQDVLAVDLVDASALSARVLAKRPETIIHLAAVSRVADAARDPVRAHEVNVDVTSELVSLADRVGARLVLASTDMVFDGYDAPYRESDTPLPTTTYARTKLAAESAVLAYPRGIAVRLPLLFGVPPLAPAACHLVDLATACTEGPAIGLFEDEFRTPMSLADAAAALLRVAQAPALTGVVHVAGPERVSRLELGRRFAAHLGLAPRFDPVRARELTFEEPRPPDLSLCTERYLAHFGVPPARDLDAMLADCASDLRLARVVRPPAARSSKRSRS